MWMRTGLCCVCASYIDLDRDEYVSEFDRYHWRIKFTFLYSLIKFTFLYRLPYNCFKYFSLKTILRDILLEE